MNPKARKYSENNVPNYWDPRSSSAELTGVGIPNFYELRDLKDTVTIFPLVISVKTKNKIETVNRNSNLKISKDFTVLDNYDELEKEQPAMAICRHSPRRRFIFSGLGRWK